MIRWLHISDLHIRKQADWYNYSKEIIKKCKDIGKINFVIVTGDFHDFKDKEDFGKSIIFLNCLIEELKLDVSQDLFVIPGNHDGVSEIDNKEDCLLAALSEPLEIQKRIDKLIPLFQSYDKFVTDLIPNYPCNVPSSVHTRVWRNKINIVHCNTAIAANGKGKNNQLLDIDELSAMTLNNDYPSILLAHNSFFDINDKQQARVKDFIRNNNIRAYLCGDQHINSVSQITYEDNQNKQIPCIVSYKSAPDELDTYSRFGMIICEWEKREAILKGWKWESGNGFSVDGTIHEKKIDMGLSEKELSIGIPQKTIKEAIEKKDEKKANINDQDINLSKKKCGGYGKRKGKCINLLLKGKSNQYCFECSCLEYYEKIVELYRIQKYNIAFDKFFFVASFKSGILEANAIVFPFYSESIKVSNETLNNFIENIDTVDTLANYTVRHLVTNGNIDSEQKKMLQQYNLEIISEDKIINEIMDFSYYLQKAISEYENNEVFKHYIDIYDDYTEDFLDYSIGKFLVEEYENGFLILGDYGCGKTTFLLNLLYTKAKEYLKGECDYIPLYIPLRDYVKAIDFDNLFVNFFSNKCNITNANLNAFKFLLKYKKFVILFDGFDEVAKRVNYDVKFAIFNEMCKYAVEGTKIIVTCRPNYFQEKKEYQKLIENAHLHFEPNTSNTAEFDQTYISELNQEQVKTYIETFNEKLQKEGLSTNEIELLIKNTHDLTDLSKRPFLLNIIIETLPKMISELKNKSEIDSININAATLYQKYTDKWLDRENIKGKSLISTKDKLHFCKHLAFKMFIEDNYSIHFKEFPMEIKNYYPDLSNAEEIDYFSHDIQSCSFLNSDGSGNFKFIHKSFMEYFVACSISEKLEKISLGNSDSINNALSMPDISTEIALFINDILNDNQFKKQNIINILEEMIDDKNIIVKENIITILSKTGYNMGKLIANGNKKLKSDYQKNDFSYSLIKDIKITNVDFSAASFYGARIENVIFENCLFSNTYFQRAKLLKVHFSNQSLECSDMSYCHIENCKFVDSFLADVQFAQSVIKNNDFDGCDMSGVESAGAEFYKNYNYKSVIGVPYEMQ